MCNYSEFIQAYASEIIAATALLFSVLSFVILSIRAKKERLVSNARYDEQKKQYEERLSEERKQRMQDRIDIDERNRISEQPYLVFKGLRVLAQTNGDHTVLELNFINKGRGSAYSIVPDVEFSCLDKSCDISITRNAEIKDPIAMQGEEFKFSVSLSGKYKDIIPVEIGISYEDAAGRCYKQCHQIHIYGDFTGFNVMSYARPELIKKNNGYSE